MEETRKYWVWLASVLGQGSRYSSELIERCGDAQSIYSADVDSLDFGKSFSAEDIGRIKEKLKNKSMDNTERIISQCDKLGIEIITYGSDRYPRSLRSLHDAPVVLYVRGKLPDTENNLLITAVGTRSMTEYGRKMAYSIGAGLAFGGAIVVSGMALGSDSMALIGALDAGGTVIAVLGSGPDVVYPTQHREIYNKITYHGAIVSEYPPGTPPLGSHFPVRNRIMSGLADGTVVIEAGEKSGSLITAENAVRQGKKLFAVPGNVGSETAVGTNNLLVNGAIPATSAEDILVEFEFIYRKTVSTAMAHAKMQYLDMNDLSLSAMNRTRIGSSTASKEGMGSYGRGGYGGRISDLTSAERESLGVNKKSGKRQSAAEDKNPEAQCETSDDKERVVTEQINPDEQKKPQAKNENKRKDGGSLIRTAMKAFGITNETKNERNEKQNVNSDSKTVQAKKIELDMLDENEIKVYNRMKPNVPMLPDELVNDEFSISTVMSALTMLEMAGAVESGSGGYFMRTSPDDIMQSPND